MSDLNQVTVPGTYPGTTLISEGDGPTGLFNNGPNPTTLTFNFSTEFGDSNKGIPFAVNQWLVLDGSRTVYAVCGSGLPTTISVLPGGLNFFNPSRAVASAVIQATAPANPKTGDLWFNTSNGNLLEQWNGVAWVPFQWGTGSIAVASITSALIAAGTIVAGIVNGTTITGAQLIADGVSGNILAYSGTPAAGNLIASYSPVDTADGFGNGIWNGWTIYSGNSALATFTSFRVNGFFFGTNQNASAGTGGLVFEPPRTIRINGLFKATDPNNAGVDENWHTLSLQNSFTAGVDINSVSYPPKYKLTPNNTVRFAGQLQTPSTGTVTGVTIGSVLSGYTPTTNIPTATLTNNTGGTAGYLYIRPNGNVQLGGGFGNSSGIRLDCEIDINV